MMIRGRAARKLHGFALRPIWAEYFVGGLSCGVIIIATLVVNAYPWPKGILKDYYAKLGQEVPEGGMMWMMGLGAPPVCWMKPCCSLNS